MVLGGNFKNYFNIKSTFVHIVHEQVYNIPLILKVHGVKGQLEVKISRKALQGCDNERCGKTLE